MFAGLVSSSLLVRVIRFVAFGLALLGLGSVTGCESDTNRALSSERASLGETHVRLHVSISDRTGQRPLSEHFAVEAPGVDLWQPNLKFGRATRQFPVYPVGKEQELYIYPQGEDGPRRRISFSMKASMKSGKAPSKTHLEIYDDSIVATGPAISGGRIAIGRRGASQTAGP